jgi:small-conductance mechanosensitive channel
VTFVILTVTSVAAVGTFCAVCIGLAAATNSRGGSEISLYIMFAGVAALVVTVVLVRLFAKWARNRYRRDIGEE